MRNLHLREEFLGNPTIPCALSHGRAAKPVVVLGGHGPGKSHMMAIKPHAVATAGDSSGIAVLPPVTPPWCPELVLNHRL